jgi:protein-S-isoprenylcysteine O-methyltransferase Ste14
MQPAVLETPALRIVGGVVLIAGLASLVECFARFVIVGLGTPAPIAPPRQLVVSGQYRYVRNPMYVAILAILVGQSLLLGSLGLLPYALLMWLVFHAWVLVYEEPKPGAQFGASYAECCGYVRRWWPRIMPWKRTWQCRHGKRERIPPG